MTTKHVLPADIERTSMQMIDDELSKRGIVLSTENAAVVKRVIHTTADFDYAETLRFTPGAVSGGLSALSAGTAIVTDTNMALAGISKPAMRKLGGAAYCFMADRDVAEFAAKRETTRAAASMFLAASRYPNTVYAVGNAPTALLELCAQMQAGLRPALIIGVPVGFVNVEESKLRLLDLCLKNGTPAIISLGRKGGSNVAAAICNALLYAASGTLDPTSRGWRG